MTAAPVRPLRLLPERLESMCAKVAADIAAARIPGATLLIADRREVLFEKTLGWQDAAKQVPLATDSIFRIYSMTKPIASLGLMMLVEQGRLLISDPVSRYLPEFSDLSVGVEVPGANGEPRLEKRPLEREMTVLDLLRHTSGLTYGIFGDSLVKREYTKAGVESRIASNQDFVRNLAELPLAYQPGTTWEYSRSTDVIGALIERLADQPLDVFLNERILKPLDMHDTGFWVPPAQQHRIAEPFPIDPDSGNPVRLANVTKAPGFQSAGGGMVSTAHDYLRFARLLANGGALEGTRLVARKTLQLMTSDHLAEMPAAKNGPANYLPGPAYGFGLGFAVRTAADGLTPGSVGDFNWSGLAGTYFWIDPAEDLIAIWLMQAPEQRAHYRQLFRNLVYAAIE